MDHVEECMSGSTQGSVLKDQSPFDIFEYEGNVIVPGRTSSFISRLEFSLGVRKKGVIPFAGFNSLFTARFLKGSARSHREPPTFNGVLFRYSNLTDPAGDKEIIESLGGLEKTVVGLAHAHTLMTFHSLGRESGLLDDGRPNNFYVSGRSGHLTVVRLRMVKAGWRVGAFDTSNLPGFMRHDYEPWSGSQGGRYFSRA